MNPKIFILSLCFLMLIAGKSLAPLCEITLADKFYDMVIGSPRQKMRAYQGFIKWPARFGHSQKDIYEMCYMESRFHSDAESKRGALGLMQPTLIAVRMLSNATAFLIRTNRKWAMKKKKVLDPYWNLYIGCRYYARCKALARPISAGRFQLTKFEVGRGYYVTGRKNLNKRIVATLRYMQTNQMKGGEINE